MFNQSSRNFVNEPNWGLFNQIKDNLMNEFPNEMKLIESKSMDIDTVIWDAINRMNEPYEFRKTPLRATPAFDRIMYLLAKNLRNYYGIEFLKKIINSTGVNIGGYDNERTRQDLYKKIYGYDDSDTHYPQYPFDFDYLGSNTLLPTLSSEFVDYQQQNQINDAEYEGDEYEGDEGDEDEYVEQFQGEQDDNNNGYDDPDDRMESYINHLLNN